ncbi:UNKNOWN [Stylonychia lemnae]|uniref:Uncharacterized protein n=1 Tax=Stylonychia lemnae TaxID=5949 RepID=A0A078AU46_STYLE|nr:UNKNOWN [Stylonychia lemnae]|eukprot:CDW85925.1 UNKNOWN [Stylonychia lemnae]
MSNNSNQTSDQKQSQESLSKESSSSSSSSSSSRTSSISKASITSQQKKVEERKLKPTFLSKRPTKLHSRDSRDHLNHSHHHHNPIQSKDDDLQRFSEENRFRNITQEIIAPFRISDIEELVLVEQRKSKINFDGLMEKFKVYNDRVNDLQKEFQAIDTLFLARDSKIDTNFQIMMDHKVEVSTQLMNFQQILTNKTEEFDFRIRDNDMRMKSIENFFKNNREFLDDINQKLAKLEYQADKQYEEVSEFMQKDIISIKQSNQRIEDQIRANMLNFNDLYQQLELTQARVEPSFKSLDTIQNFIVNSLPLLIHLHVSDSLQEFLNVQDRLKLIQFDNKKLQQLRAFVDNSFLSQTNLVTQSDNQASKESIVLSGNLSEIQENENGDTITTQEIKEIKDKTYLVKNLNQRLDNLLKFMSEKEKGCLRFEYGKDWKKQMTEEQINHIDRSYQMILDQKYNYLEKTNNMIKENERIIREKKQEAKRLLQQKIDLVHDSPNRRNSIINDQSQSSIRPNNEIVFYKELILVRTTTKSIIHRETLNARRLKSRQIKNRNQQKMILNQLLKEQDELQSEKDFSEDSSGEDPNSPKKQISRSPTSGQVSKSRQLLQKQFTEIKHLFDPEDKKSRLQSRKQSSPSGKGIIQKNNHNHSRDSETDPQSQLSTYDLPSHVKERMQILLQLGFRQTQRLQKKINRLVQIHKEQSITQNQSLEKGINKMKKVKSKFTDMVDYLDSKVNEQITKYNKNVENIQEEFQIFKDTIQSEYIDFFKNRKRIATEISVMTKSTNERLDNFSNLIDRFSSNHETVNQIIPILIESLHLQIAAFFKDNQDRETLSMSLRLGEIANDGYLMVDQVKQSKNNGIRISSQSNNFNMTSPITIGKKDFINENINSQVMPQIQSIDKIARMTPDIPIAENYQGSLHMKSTSYRKNELSRIQVFKIQQSFIERLENLILNQQIFADSGLIPKVIFDDYYLDLFGQIQANINKRPQTTMSNGRKQVPISQSFQNNSIKTAQLNPDQSMSDIDRDSKMKSRNTGVQNMSKSVGVSNARIHQSNAATNTSAVISSNLNPQRKQNILDCIEQKTQKIVEHGLRRDSMIQEFLNRTMDENQKSNTNVLGNTQTSIVYDLNSLESYDIKPNTILIDNVSPMSRDRHSPTRLHPVMNLTQTGYKPMKNKQVGSGVNYSYTSNGRVTEMGKKRPITQENQQNSGNKKNNNLSQSLHNGIVLQNNSSKPGTSYIKRRNINTVLSHLDQSASRTSSLLNNNNSFKPLNDLTQSKSNYKTNVLLGAQHKI